MLSLPENYHLYIIQVILFELPDLLPSYECQVKTWEALCLGLAAKDDIHIAVKQHCQTWDWVTVIGEFAYFDSYADLLGKHSVLAKSN